MYYVQPLPLCHSWRRVLRIKPLSFFFFQPYVQTSGMLQQGTWEKVPGLNVSNVEGSHLTAGVLGGETGHF